MPAIGEQLLSVKTKIKNYLMELSTSLIHVMPCYFLHVILYEELKKYEKTILQLEWARDCKANDYVYLGQVSHIDETKDINQLYAVRDESIV